MLDWKSLLYSDKPQSLSVKNFLIRKMSTAMMVSEKIITSVIDHQFTSLIENMSTCNSLEISGFGKFLFNKRKANEMMIFYLKEQIMVKNEVATFTDAYAKKRGEIRLSILEMQIKALNQKLQSYENQFRSNI